VPPVAVEAPPGRRLLDPTLGRRNKPNPSPSDRVRAGSPIGAIAARGGRLTEMNDG
jgi:hypothetical protein